MVVLIPNAGGIAEVVRRFLVGASSNNALEFLNALVSGHRNVDRV